MPAALPTFAFDPATLPSPPAVVMRLVRLMADANAHLREVVAPLKTDAALCAQVLATCNSAVNQRGHKVVSIEAAVVRLGCAEVNRIVCAAAFRQVFGGATSHYSETADVLWHRSVYAAVAMEELTEAAAERDQAYLAGLLHLAGVFLVSRIRPHTGGPRIDADALAQAGAAETALFGVRSCEVGAQALAAWGLPRPVCLAVRHQHDPESAGEAAALAARLQVASRLGIEATARNRGAPGVLMTQATEENDDELYALSVRASRRARVLLG